MNIETTRGVIRNYINSALADSNERNSKTLEAARYMALNDFGGLYRPLLLLATARGYSVGIEKALPIGTAIEFVHVASLIEDDIMDNSDTRRGKMACHTKFGEPVAHLAHMYLREAAEEQITLKNSLSNPQRIAIARKAFRTGKSMVYGQERDVLQRDIDSVDKVVRMYAQKSGALLGAALVCGGIVGRACEEDVCSLDMIGINAGVSYQIIDDALDSLAPASQTGKPANQDSAKQTLLKIVGWEGVKKLKGECDAEVDRLLATLHGDPCFLGDLIHHLRHKHDNYINA